MRPKLILRLASDVHAALRWALLRRDGSVAEHGETSEPAELTRFDAALIALVPAADVRLAAVAVPTQNRHKLLRAIPYALEDSLAGDVEAQHYALGQRDTQGRWAVAVVRADWLAQWLQRLRAAGLMPQQLLPETLCLPWEAGQWSVLLEDSAFAVRNGVQQGFGGDRENLELLLGAALEEAGEQRPAGITVYTAATAAHLPEQLSGVPLEVRPLASPLALLGAGCAQPAQIQLLSGPYAAGQGERSRWRPWVPTLVLLALWLGLDSGAALLEQRRLQLELTALEQQNLALLQELLPEARDLHGARARVENRLAQLRGGGRGEDALLATLAELAPILGQGDGIRLTGLSYRNGHLELELTAADLQRLDRLQQQLDAAAALTAEVRSARAEDDAVQGRLLVRRTL